MKIMNSESRIAQISTNPIVSEFAITASQEAIRKVGNFLAPIVLVPDLQFHIKTYTENFRYRIPNTLRQPGSPATRLGFSVSDTTLTLTPNALDFPIPNVEKLSDEGLQFSIMEGQGTLADSAALALEQQIISTGLTSALSNTVSTAADFTDNTVDPVAILDGLILSVKKQVKNGAPIRVLFGTTKFKQFRDNANVRSRFIVSSNRAASGLGMISPAIDDVSSLLITNPEVMMSEMVDDTSSPGATSNIQFLLDSQVIVFAAKANPDRLDPSFMKTFARDGGFFRSGSYMTEDQRDNVLKMDWLTLPYVTNSTAGATCS